MVNCKPQLNESQLEALYRFHCHNASGSRYLAYEGIVANGRNAATLHYIKNDDTIKDGELILADLGFRFYGYCSDITCTFPANGRFT